MKTQFYPGQPVRHSDMANDRHGYIVSVSAPSTKSFMLAAGGMEQVDEEITVVWLDDNGHPDGKSRDLPGSIAERYAQDAGHLPAITAEEVRALEVQADARIAAEQAAAAERAKQRQAEQERFEAEFNARRPAWAKAVIVAEYWHDESDTMTDYFGGRSGKRLLLAWSKHPRDLFPEMRKAARNAEEVAHLVDAPKSAEHREKYSMGHGYYLTTGTRYSGWQIRKIDLAYGSAPQGEWRIPDDTPTPPTGGDSKAPRKPSKAPAGGTPSTCTIEKHQHTKKGFDMWLVILADRVDRDQFADLRASAQEAGGWYSRKWGRTPGGFAFRSEEAAAAFAASLAGETSETQPEQADTPETEPVKMTVYGWDSCKLADAYTLDELDQLRRKVQAEHRNPRGEDGRYTENGQPSIYLYSKRGRKKLDAMGWAIYHRLGAEKDAQASPQGRGGFVQRESLTPEPSGATIH